MNVLFRVVPDVLLDGLRRIYPSYGLRDDDIILSSYPKSGNTWVRFIWANIIALEEFGGATVDFSVVNGGLGSEFDNHTYGKVEFECLPRLVKTHWTYDEAAFGNCRLIYLWRHPGDVAISYFHYHRSGMKRDAKYDNLSAFIRSDSYGIKKWCEHVQSWLPRADIVLRYDAMQRDTVGMVECIFDELVIEKPSQDIIREAVRRSTFREMRRIEDEKGRAYPKRFEESSRFTRKGEVGEWKEVMSEEDKVYMRDVIKRAGLEGLVYSNKKVN